LSDTSALHAEIIPAGAREVFEKRTNFSSIRQLPPRGGHFRDSEIGTAPQSQELAVFGDCASAVPIPSIGFS
jgi:hypothetical protein